MKTSARITMAMTTTNTTRPKATINHLHSLILAGVNDLRLAAKESNTLRKIRPI